MFEADRIYVRRDLHARYGGQWQGGISTPASIPVIFLFTGDSGEAYGYHDGWTSQGVFQYSGEGQKGDMTFSRGNLAIRDHVNQGKQLHLFQNVGRGKVRYVGEMELDGYELVPRIPDREGNLREGIMFRLRRVST